MHSAHVARLAAGMVIFLAAVPVRAETSLVALTPVADALSPASVVEYEARLKADDLYEAQEIDLLLPDGLFIAERVDAEQQAHGVFWRGRIHGVWDVLLTTHKGTISGLVFTPGHAYEVIPGKAANDGTSRLADLDGDRFPACGVDENTTENPPIVSPPQGAPPLLGDPQHPVMDAMVLYTAQARIGAGGQSQIEATIQSAVNITNTAYGNSQVDAHLHLIHFEEAPFNDSGSASTDLSTLRGDSTVSTLRDSYGADLVALISQPNGACGVGYGMRNPGPSFEGFAFQVTARTCAVGNLTFAHEFGHNQGCEHDPANGTAPSSASFPFSFGHYHSGSYRTVMSYSNQCTSSCPRAPHFSNSTIQRSGLDTGILDQRENYRTINNTASIVAAFRPSAVLLNIAQPSYTVSERDGSLTVVVSRTGRADIAVNAVVRTEAVQAVAGQDFSDTTTNLQWAAGDTTTRSVTIPILDDRDSEGTETFDIVIEDARGAGLGVTSRVPVTINDYEEGTLRFSATEVQIREDRPEVVLEVVRAAGSNGEVSAAFTTTMGTASAEDFQPQSGRLVWSDLDDTPKQIVLPLTDDRSLEGPEQLTVTLSGIAGGAQLADATTTVTIVDWEEGTVSLSDANLSVREDAGAVVVSVDRTNGANGEVSVDLSFEAANPAAAAGADFVDTPLRVTFPDGADGLSTVSVPIIDDILEEADERFVVLLGSPTNGAVNGNITQATVQILDWEEGAVSFASPTAAVREDAGQLEVQVLRIDGQDGPATVLVETFTGTASAGEDFTAVASTLQWGEGDASSRTVAIALIDDTVVEGDESFTVRLSTPSGARLGEVTELDVALADFEVGRIGWNASTQRVSEDQGELLLEARRFGGTSGAVSAQYRVLSGTAQLDADFADATGTVTFGDGQMTPVEVRIPLIDDLISEPDETFDVELFAPTGGAEIGPPVRVTLLDSGAGEVIAVEDGYEVGEGATELVIQVERRGETNGSLVVDYRTESNEATSPSDFTEVAGQLQWDNAEAGIRAITIPIVSDESEEGRETFSLVLTTDDATATVRSPIVVAILDDDGGCACSGVESRGPPATPLTISLLLAAVGLVVRSRQTRQG